MAIRSGEFTKSFVNYPGVGHIVSKLTDADGENGETETWLDFARECGCLADSDHAHLVADCRQMGAMLGAMLSEPTPFVLKPPRPMSSTFTADIL